LVVDLLLAIELFFVRSPVLSLATQFSSCLAGAGIVAASLVFGLVARLVVSGKVAVTLPL
jgi:hypothetical protein